MKVVRIHSYGSSDQLQVEDVPRPMIHDDQILVRVHDAGVNPVDWKIREGYMKEVRPAKFPLVIGQDFAGEIIEVGRDVTGFRVGDEVFGFAHGSYAELAVAKPDRIARVPETIGFAAAAAIPTAGLTAWQILDDTADVQPGQRVLIQGAAGGVGSFAVQIAKAKGARVFGTASAQDAGYLADLGVERIVDYKTERFDEIFRDLDVVVDLVGGDTLARSYQVLRKGGLVVSTVGPVREEEARKHGVEAIQFVMSPEREGLERLAELVDKGTVKPRLTEIMPLTDVRRAHDINQKGHSHGKIVLHVM